MRGNIFCRSLNEAVKCKPKPRKIPSITTFVAPIFAVLCNETAYVSKKVLKSSILYGNLNEKRNQST